MSFYAFSAPTTHTVRSTATAIRRTLPTGLKAAGQLVISAALQRPYKLFAHAQTSVCVKLSYIAQLSEPCKPFAHAHAIVAHGVRTASAVSVHKLCCIACLHRSTEGIMQCQAVYCCNIACMSFQHVLPNFRFEHRTA